MTSTQVSIVYWRDIPAQVISKAGSESKRLPLSARFQEAIDMAAMRGGAEAADAYMADWRRSDPEAVDGDVAAAADAVASRLERTYGSERLQRLARSGGREGA
ncbi:MAG: virulence factor [Hyphomicrobiaceae bacterium]|nr:virulence factor [Hyphomicrobiaceae bacterium]